MYWDSWLSDVAVVNICVYRCVEHIEFEAESGSFHQSLRNWGSIQLKGALAGFGEWGCSLGGRCSAACFSSIMILFSSDRKLPAKYLPAPAKWICHRWSDSQDQHSSIWRNSLLVTQSIRKYSSWSKHLVQEEVFLWALRWQHAIYGNLHLLWVAPAGINCCLSYIEW